MSNSFFPYFTKLWNSLDKSLKCEPDINIFKTKLKDFYKSRRRKHFNKSDPIKAGFGGFTKFPNTGQETTTRDSLQWL